jgi:hypothetical protein
VQPGVKIGQPEEPECGREKEKESGQNKQTRDDVYN